MRRLSQKHRDFLVTEVLPALGILAVFAAGGAIVYAITVGAHP